MAEATRRFEGDGHDGGDLVRRLVAVHDRIAFPPTPDLVAQVRMHLDAPIPRGRLHGLHSLPRDDVRRRVLLSATLVILVGAIGMLAFPRVRSTVAGWLDIPGVRIVFDDAPPAPTSPPIGAGLFFGEGSTTAEAQAAVGFAILRPGDQDWGDADETYLRHRVDGDLVALIYYPRPGLPPVAGTGAGLLLVEFEADADSVWFQKKSVGDGTEVDVVRVDGQEGLWLGGSHQLQIYPDPSGSGAGGTPSSRETANVLLWNRDGITYRLESALSKEAMVAIAESLVPAAPDAS